MIAVIYKPGAVFQPKALRDALSGLEINVLRLHISARGQVKEEDGKQFFIAGSSRFLLANSPKIPTATPVGAVGVVDDSTETYQLKIDDYKLLKP